MVYVATVLISAYIYNYQKHSINVPSPAFTPGTNKKLSNLASFNNHITAKPLIKLA